jgi:hypothetical protein
VVLLAVSGPLNEAKGDRPADGWTPPDTGERTALSGLLAHCG